MRWSIGLMIASIPFFALAVVALWFGGLGIGSLEAAVSFAGTGALLLLVGFVLRKVTKTFE